MERRIYTLNGLPPEVIAVAFAKCSRSPENFDVIAKELNEDKSRKFHEKWVVGYGHSSVAEHAVLSLAIENVSMLATKVIEDNRLASYTEKSTRYQEFDRSRFYVPEISESSRKLYLETMHSILDKYAELIPKMTEFMIQKYPEAKEIEIKNKAFDELRNMLPVSVLTNLGMTINARNLERAIVKLLSHPLKEMNEIGYGLKQAALKITPTLVRYTEPSKYMIETERDLVSSKVADIPESRESVSLVDYDKDAEQKILAAILYRLSDVEYEKIRKKVEDMSDEEKQKIISLSLSRMEKFDSPLREFEHAYYTFDVLVDYGAFRDIQRHRMMTQTNQDFSPIYGFDVPKELAEAGLHKDFVDSMKQAKSAFRIIEDQHPKEAQYVLPMAFKKRVLIKANLRELFHFIKLRSSKAGHESYRHIAKEMFEKIRQVHPFLAGFIKADLS